MIYFFFFDADSHPNDGLSGPMMKNILMMNPTLRMLMPMMHGGMGLHGAMDAYAKMMGMDPAMMNMYLMLQNPYFQQSLPYAMMGFTPNLFGHGMPIHHGTRFENTPLHQAQRRVYMARQGMDNMYGDGQYEFYDENGEPIAPPSAPSVETSSNGGYHGGFYQNGGKHPLHSPWRVKMRRCRLKNGQRVIFPASQVNMDKFHQICEYDPDTPPKPKYTVDINVPVQSLHSLYV